MITDCTAVLMPFCTTLAFISALRLTGVVRKRFSVPRSISSSVPMPAHMLEPSALITTMPGIR